MQILTEEQLTSYLREVDLHLRMLGELRPTLVEIRDVLRDDLEERRRGHGRILEDLIDAVGRAPAAAPLAGQVVPSESERDYETDLKTLRAKLDSDAWPAAVGEFTISLTPEMRAGLIHDTVLVDEAVDHAFCDLTGDGGEVAAEALLRGASSAAALTPDGAALPDGVVGGDETGVCRHGPYDVVLLMDCLDHDEDPVSKLKLARSIMRPHGRCVVRLHPWWSRHGGHLHETLNKAFAHLVFDEAELMRHGGHVAKPTKILDDPETEYRAWFREAGLRVVQEFPVSIDPEPFFESDRAVRRRLESRLGGRDFRRMLSLTFFDYVLEPDSSSV